MSNPTTSYCSFCGKSQYKVKQLVAGPKDAFICNECTWLCWEIIIESGSIEPKFKEISNRARQIILEEVLGDIEHDLLRLNAERDNTLYDLATLQQVSVSTVH